MSVGKKPVLGRRHTFGLQEKNLVEVGKRQVQECARAEISGTFSRSTFSFQECNLQVYVRRGYAKKPGFQSIMLRDHFKALWVLDVTVTHVYVSKDLSDVL